MKTRAALIILALLSNLPFAFTQETSTSTAGSSASLASSVPRLIRFSGVAKDATGKASTGTIGITFFLYKDQEGGAPLWMETQNVQPEANGHYSVQLGATKSGGLPTDAFTSGEARWLGVQVQGEAEQPRVMLLAVPYALKAADAETLGGKPLSLFQLVPPQSKNSSGTQKTQPPAEQLNEIACAGGAACKTSFIPKFSTNGGSATVNNSIISQSGTNITIAGSETVIRKANGSALWGESFGTNAGSNGVHGVTHSGTAAGVAGINVGSGFSGIGVYGASSGGTGVYGTGGVGGYGVHGVGADEFIGVFAQGGGGNAEFFSGGAGLLALGGTETNTSTTAGDGVDTYGGEADQGGIGIYAQGGKSRVVGGGDGIDAYAGTGANGNGFAGNFFGDAQVSGNFAVGGAIFAGTKDFKIDHPLDPANKYFYHASVESYEMMNIYTGNVVLDPRGAATVRLPDWFEAVNTDFRYQLTSIGTAAPNLHIAQEVANHQFSIAGGVPGMKVSWQVSGVRHDAFAEAHPLVVQEDKPANERGYYIHPSLYGQPEEKQIEWGRFPAKMRHLKELQTGQVTLLSKPNSQE